MTLGFHSDYYAPLADPTYFYLYGHSAMLLNETRIAFAGGQLDAVVINSEMFGRECDFTVEEDCHPRDLS